MSVAFAEGKVTKLRREFKLLLEERQARALCTWLLPSLDEGAPQPTQVVSVYFDRPGLPLASRALLRPQHCLKVRTKEYFPDLDGAQGPRLVLEVKRECNGMTQKRRAWFPRRELARQLPNLGRGELRPVLAVSYERHVYQRHEAWRVTVDRAVSFHRITPELALGTQGLTVERLGAPEACEPRTVVEVKHLGQALPLWIAGLEASKTVGFSKFAQGMRRLWASELGWVGNRRATGG